MDNLLNKTRQAVERYHSKQAVDKMKATRTILAAVLACRNFIKTSEVEDPGKNRQLASELSEVLSVLPMFRKFAADKKFLNNLETEELADEHLNMIERDLENSIKEMQDGKKKKIQDWVKSHPVLGKLKKSTTKDLPQGAYVLLFRRSANLPPKRKGSGKRDLKPAVQSKNESPIANLAVLEQPALDNESVAEQSMPIASQIITEAVAEKYESSDRQSETEEQFSGHHVSEERSSEQAGTLADERQEVSAESGQSSGVSDEDCQDRVISEGDEALADEAANEDVDSASKLPLDEEATEADESKLPIDEESTEADESKLSLDEEAVEAHESKPSLFEETAEADESKLPTDAEADATEESKASPAHDADFGKEGKTLPNHDVQASFATISSAETTAKPPVEKIPPDLVVRPAADGKVFTRFRPKEFSDDSRVYRMFRGGPPLVGACIIADGKLITSIGVLPQPAEGRDQLRLLLSISKDAVGKPGRDFVESNLVLNELFQLCKSRSIHKDAYVLLFQHVEEKVESSSVEPGSSVLDKSSPDSSSESVSADEEVQSEAFSELSAPEESQSDPDSSEVDESEDSLLSMAGAEESVVEPGDDEDGAGSVSGTAAGGSEIQGVLESGNGANGAVSPKCSVSDKPAQTLRLELVSKRTEDGRVITRYRSFDFSDIRSLYETFKNRPPIVGAAIIRERELIKVLGIVPEKEGTRQLDVLLGVSRQALEKPALEFIASNQVLNNLYELSNGEYRQKEYDVVLFAETDGRPEILLLSDRMGRMLPKTPLSEFRIPKLMHERFKSERPVVGASIIGEQAAPAQSKRDLGARANKDKDKDKDRDRDRGSKPDFKGRASVPRSSIVVAAFGRTPLKQNVLLSVEILKRLGVDLSIL